MWWSGGFVKGTMPAGSSPAACLPGLIRMNPATGDMRVITAPTGWGSWRDNKEVMVNPWAPVVHVAGDRVIWHIGFLGLWEVVGERMELRPIFGPIFGLAGFSSSE